MYDEDKADELADQIAEHVRKEVLNLPKDMAVHVIESLIETLEVDLDAMR